MRFSKIELELMGPIATIRLNDPKTMNAAGTPMLEEIDSAIEQIASSARVLRLTGSGRGFCSGAPLNGDVDTGTLDDGPDYGAGLETHVNPLMMKLRSLPFPWISAVNGPAAGFGCALALAADIIIASESAYFLQAFVRVGLAPDGGSSFLLTRGLTRARAMEMMLLGKNVSAATALEWGLINRVVPAAELERESFDLARSLANGPTKALGAIRKLAWAALDGNWLEALTAERDVQFRLGRTRDVAEGLDAFVNKRPAMFEGC